MLCGFGCGGMGIACEFGFSCMGMAFVGPFGIGIGIGIPGLFSAKITSDLIILPKLIAYFCSHLCIMPSDLADLYHGDEHAFT